MFVELPEPGKSVTQGEGFGAVESVKATSDVNSPISGEVVEVNTKLTESPGSVILLFYLNPLHSLARNLFRLPIRILVVFTKP